MPGGAGLPLPNNTAIIPFQHIIIIFLYFSYKLKSSDQFCYLPYTFLLSLRLSVTKFFICVLYQPLVIGFRVQRSVSFLIGNQFHFNGKIIILVVLFL